MKTIESAIVTAIFDGDTIRIAGGKRVRFIGIDAPERKDEPGFTDALKFVAIAIGGDQGWEKSGSRPRWNFGGLQRRVWLESDGEDVDRHGRLRRYIWLEEPANPNDEDEIKQKQLNAILLHKGLVRVLKKREFRNKELFIQLENGK